MTNREILNEELSIKNKYQALKEEIVEKLHELDTLDEEYVKCSAELKKRGITL